VSESSRPVLVVLLLFILHALGVHVFLVIESDLLLESA
jgi:hypothetical protein